MDFKLGKIRYGFLETATSGGTLTLTSSSKQYQILTGSSNHTVVLPDATTLATDIVFVIVNVGTGTITVKLADTTTTLTTIAAGGGATIIVTDISTSNGTWRTKIGVAGSAGGSGSVPPGATKTSDYTVVSGDNSGIINVSTVAGSIVQITLPAPSAGFKVTIKDVGGLSGQFQIGVLRNGSETIDGVAGDSAISENYGAATFISDGTNWSRYDSFRKNGNAGSGRAVIAGGNISGTLQTGMEYIFIATTGNGTSFGTLSAAKSDGAPAASSVRGLFGGGITTGPTTVNTIDYITISTTGNGTSFGTLSEARADFGGASNDSRGIFCGGVNSSSVLVNTIDYVTIATTGNAIDFGDLTSTRTTEALASAVRMVSGGGLDNSDNVLIMDYVTIANLGNATSFGNLTLRRRQLAACSSAVRGLFAGGNEAASSNIIDYITIATTGNAIDFGDLVSARRYLTGSSSALRGIFSGGGESGAPVNTIEYVTIATPGNTTNFGNLIAAKTNLMSCSNSHGGLSG